MTLVKTLSKLALHRPLRAAAVLLGFLFAVAAPPGAADAGEKTIRVGYQKYGTLILVKSKGALEEKLKPLGYDVTWSEFASGPALLEALNAGAIDVGTTGETPPIFSQAAGVDLVYVANEPASPRGEAILVPKTSAIKTVADLKGKKVALNKGSNVHYLLVRALEAAGLAYTDIQTVFLPPADARAAFEKGAVDAWVIWDPYLAAAEAATGGRTLATGEGLVPNNQFYLATGKYSAQNPQAVDAFVDAIAEVDKWAEKNPAAVAEVVSPLTGIPAPILAIALQRQSYGVQPIDAKVIAEQQKIADAFLALGLIPKPIVIADAIRKPRS